MAQRRHRVWSGLALVAGLSLWTLAPYGGCACENPLSGSGPSGTKQIYGGLEAGLVPAGLVDDFNDGLDSNSPTGHWQNVFVGGVLKQVWFNGNDPAYRVNFWGGGTYTQADAFGSQYYSKLGSGADDPSFINNPNGGLQFGSPTTMYGRDVPPIVCGATNDCGVQYPFVQHGMFLSPGGAAGDANVEFVNEAQAPGQLTTAEMSIAGAPSPTNPSHGLRLDYETPYNALTVKMILLYLYTYTHSVPCTYTDTFQYHEFTLPVSPGGWATAYIPFSSFKLPVDGGQTQSVGGSAIAATEGTKLVYGTGPGAGTLANSAAWSGGTLRIQAIEFDATSAGGNSSVTPPDCSTVDNIFDTQTPYEFLIDNVEFY